MALNITATVGLDGSGFNRGIEQITDHVKGLAAQAFGLYAIEQAIRGTVEWASKLRDVSDELGVSTDWLQEMNYGLAQAGSGLEDLTKLVIKLSEARQKAVGSGPEAQKMQAAFAKFGITQGEIQTGEVQNLVDKIARSFETGVQQELIPAFKEIGGKGAPNMIAAFIAGLSESREAARAAGAIIAEDVIDELDELQDRFTQLGLILKSSIAPTLVWIVDKLDKAIRGWKMLLESAYDIATKGYVGGERGAEWQELIQGSEDFKKMKEAREAARRANRQIPTFTAPDIETRTHGGVRGIPIYSDALTSVGNFLGTSAESFPRIATQQLSVLRQIETNTRRSSGSGGTYYPP